MTKTYVAGRVSIVIPAYNCAGTIAATVQSCLKQSYPDIEIIVANDGSTDGTSGVLSQFSDRVRILNKRNGGVAASRNAGMQLATGEYVVWMDHDDLMFPDRVSIQVAVLQADPDLWLVSSDFSAFRDEAEDFELSHIGTYYSAVRRLGGIGAIYAYQKSMERSSRQYQVRWGGIYEELISGNFVHPPTVMVRCSAFERAGLFDEALTYNSEYDMVFRIARLGPVAYVDAPLLRYRRSETQLSHGTGGGKIPMETIRVLEKVRAEDPSLYQRRTALFKHRIAVQYTDAADVLGPSDRTRALRLLWLGVRQKLLPFEALHALGRIIVPRIIVTVAKFVFGRYPGKQ